MDSRHSLKQFGSGLGGLPFPLIADFFPHGAVAKDYGVFNEENGASRRAVFIVDKSGAVQWAKVYSSPPDMDELLQAIRHLVE